MKIASFLQQIVFPCQPQSCPFLSSTVHRSPGGQRVGCPKRGGRSPGALGGGVDEGRLPDGDGTRSRTGNFGSGGLLGHINHGSGLVVTGEMSRCRLTNHGSGLVVAGKVSRRGLADHAGWLIVADKVS